MEPNAFAIICKHCGTEQFIWEGYHYHNNNAIIEVNGTDEAEVWVTCTVCKNEVYIS